MSATIGIQKCGCITFACADKLRRDDERALTKIIRNGGSVEHRDDFDALRADPNFLPWECPHDPKGWEPKP